MSRDCYIYKSLEISKYGPDYEIRASTVLLDNKDQGLGLST